jgi:hypothetical protein
MIYNFEVEMSRGEEFLVTAVFSSLDDAKKYIKSHGETDIKFSLYKLVNETEKVLI